MTLIDFLIKKKKIMERKTKNAIIPNFCILHLHSCQITKSQIPHFRRLSNRLNVYAGESNGMTAKEGAAVSQVDKSSSPYRTHSPVAKGQ